MHCHTNTSEKCVNRNLRLSHYNCLQVESGANALQIMVCELKAPPHVLKQMFRELKARQMPSIYWHWMFQIDDAVNIMVLGAFKSVLQ